LVGSDRRRCLAARLIGRNELPRTAPHELRFVTIEDFPPVLADRYRTEFGDEKPDDGLDRGAAGGDVAVDQMRGTARAADVHMWVTYADARVPVELDALITEFDIVVVARRSDMPVSDDVGMQQREPEARSSR
jgi:hypothetical protein